MAGFSPTWQAALEEWPGYQPTGEMTRDDKGNEYLPIVCMVRNWSGILVMEAKTGQVWPYWRG